MFKKRTLFVVGAGASYEVGLPVGAELAATIRKKMDVLFEDGIKLTGDGDHDLLQQLHNKTRVQTNILQDAAFLIRDGIVLAQSIDDFLDQHRTNATVNLYGKAAIVKSILEAERNSSIFFGGPVTGEFFNPEKVANTWLVKFFHLLTRGVPKEALGTIFDNVAFIVFNYDRCIEYFLENALQKAYSISENEAAQWRQSLRIIHPYGRVDYSVAFGAARVDYAALSQGIKTYTDQIDDRAILDSIENEMFQAEQIVFLGFGYHDQNMQLMQTEVPIGVKPIFGTAYKMSNPDVSIITNQINGWLGDLHDPEVSHAPIYIDNGLTCVSLFGHFTKSLSAGGR